MSLPEYLLDLPAEEAARLIALALLDRTAEAARRLGDPTDPTALHDFRVATRRLRSCLQAYRPEIDGSVDAAAPPPPGAAGPRDRAGAATPRCTWPGSASRSRR